MRVGHLRVGHLIVAVLLMLSASATLSAQPRFETLGPNECINCHDHQPEREWYERREIPEVQRLFPDMGNTAGHINSLKQMEAPNSDKYAAAIQLEDKYSLNGACVRCHATVFAGDANAGVSCESCHGPAGGYNKPHQTKGAYDVSVAQYGMAPLVGNMQAWIAQCTTCHVMDDQRLIDAGHPSGDQWDFGVKYQPVALHFKREYSPQNIMAVAKAEMLGIMRRRRPGMPPMPPALELLPAALPLVMPGAPPTTSAAPVVPVAPRRPPAAATSAPVAVAPIQAPAAGPGSTPPVVAELAQAAPPSGSAPAPVAAPPATPPVAVTVAQPQSGLSGLNMLLIGIIVLMAAAGAAWWKLKR